MKLACRQFLLLTTATAGFRPLRKDADLSDATYAHDRAAHYRERERTDAGGALRVFPIVVLLSLSCQHASAAPSQCEQAMLSTSISGIERYCAHLKSSQDNYWRKNYYFILGLAYARAYKQTGSDDPMLGKAISNISEAIAISARGKRTREDAEMYEMRGILYLENKPSDDVISKDADKALEDLNVAISLNPNKATAYLYRGYAHNQLLNPDAAWADFQKAKALNPSDATIREAWEKQRQFTPEGLKETRKKLEEIARPNNGK